MPKSVSSSGAKALQSRPVPSSCQEGGALACLSAKDIAALSKAREARWRPGLSDQPWHSEIFAQVGDASGAGVALALARDALRVAGMGKDGSERDPLADAEDRRQVLWVQDSRAIKRGGRPYAQGLPPELRGRLIHVEATTPEDALFALEEGLRCRDLACVIGEIVGNPRALDFTASRRLSLAAEKHGVALWLVRLAAEADLSSARMRWRVEPAPSAPSRWNADAPGGPAWKAELFRARSHAPGHWILSHASQPERLTARRPSEIRPPETRHAEKHAANETHTAAPYSGHLARATVGRSLAARARM